jgi:hypothetical protein
MTFLISILGINIVQHPIFNVYGSGAGKRFQIYIITIIYFASEATSWSKCFLYSLHQVSWTAILQLAVQKRNKAGKMVTLMQSSVHVA